MADILSSPMVPIALMLVVMYFLILRPQQQRAKELRSAIDNIRRGDTVVTAAGIVGKVAKAPQKEDAEVTVEIAENVQVRVIKGTLTEVRAKSQPVDAKADKS
jgi:preprotein translocase subunit YajC